MDPETISPPIDVLIKRFLEWADGPAGIIRPPEIKIVPASDPNLGLIGILDLSSTLTTNGDEELMEHKAKRTVRVFQLVTNDPEHEIREFPILTDLKFESTFYRPNR